MFKSGDTVLYSSEGVCRIKEITIKNFGDTSIEYYVLEPVFNNRSTFFVPSKNEKLTSRMHTLLKYDELTEIIKNSADNTWIENDAQRKEIFKSILSEGEISAIISMFKTIMNHKIDIENSGKKLHKPDESAYKEAQKIIYEQFAMYVDISKDDVPAIILTQK
ncbi:MAG: CarD family transcriptional regulator [Clostridia bacterium]|nr:CarD family transcriptional regulator [Clostridia bacterium]